MSSILRSYCRHQALVKMKKRGMKQLCKHDYGGREDAKFVIGSYFSNHWRDYCRYSPK